MFEDEAPERLAKIALDADPDLKLAVWTYRETLDEIDRPGIYVECVVGDYPPTASGVLNGEEAYTVVILGHTFGTGSMPNGDMEKQVRRIAKNVGMAIWQRQQLQFSNARHKYDAALGALAGVESVRLRRDALGIIEREGLGTKIWGSVFTVTVVGVFVAQEILVFPDRE